MGWGIEKSIDKINLKKIDDLYEIKLKDIVSLDNLKKNVDESQDFSKINQKDLFLRLDLLQVDEEIRLSSLVEDISEWIKGDMTIITPPARLKNWKRYNDDLDYFQEKVKQTPAVNFLLGQEIYPYHQGFVISKTGEPLTDIERDVCLITGNLPKEKINQEYANSLEKKGLDFSKDKKEQIHQTCPEIVKEILKFLEYDGDILEFKPVFATYWA